jgi:hypothetical protein
MDLSRNGYGWSDYYEQSADRRGQRGKRTLIAQRIIPLDEIGQKLWLRMIQDNLLEGKTGSRFLFGN